MIVVHEVPKTKLWHIGSAGAALASQRPVGEHVIVLECDCGHAVDYPGHPDERTSVECGVCGATWTIRAAAVSAGAIQ